MDIWCSQHKEYQSHSRNIGCTVQSQEDYAGICWWYWYGMSNWNKLIGGVKSCMPIPDLIDILFRFIAIQQSIVKTLFVCYSTLFWIHYLY